MLYGLFNLNYTDEDTIATKAIGHVDKEDKTDDELAEHLSSDEVFWPNIFLHIMLISLINIDDNKKPSKIVSLHEQFVGLIMFKHGINLSISVFLIDTY